MTLHIASLRRYPVKSMGGEGLPAVELDARGLAGDRWFAVRDDDGRLASGKDTRRLRRRDAVFSCSARTDSGGRVWVRGAGDERAVGDPVLDAELSSAMDARVRVRAQHDVAHQDGGAVSLVGTATLDWCARRWGVLADPRRLRVNVVVATDEPFAEEGWVGRRVVCGEVALDVVQQVTRCRTVDLDQDGVRARGGILRPLGAERGLKLAVYADVAVAGALRTGDLLEVE